MIKGLDQIQPVNYKPCGKRKYGTRQSAKKALIANNRIHDDDRLKSIYFCESCVAWHTTSWGKQGSRDKQRQRNNEHRRNSRT